MYLYNCNLKTNKNIHLVLTYIFGIGVNISLKITKKLGFCKNLNLSLLTKNQMTKLKKGINYFSFFLSDNLKKFKIINFKNSIKLSLLKSIRRLKNLPVRGQRSKTNSKTAKKGIF